MLDDRERQVLGEIERRLQLEDPALVRFFDGVQHAVPAEHGRGTDVVTALAGITLWTVLLLGTVPVSRPEIDVFGTRTSSEIGAAIPGAPRGQPGPAPRAILPGPGQIPIDIHRKGDSA